MTLRRLVQIVSRRLGYKYEEAWVIADELVSVMAEHLSSGEDIKIRGLGSLEWKDRVATRRRHPKTRKMVGIPARRVLTFRPTARLRPKEE